MQLPGGGEVRAESGGVYRCMLASESGKGRGVFQGKGFQGKGEVRGGGGWARREWLGQGHEEKH